MSLFFYAFLIPLFALLLPSFTCSQALDAPLETIACPEGTPFKNITCGKFNVPLDYDNPQGEKLSLWFAIINGTIAGQKPEAFTVITGGPGGSSSMSSLMVVLPAYPLESLQQPTVVLDVRGSGLSQVLECPFNITVFSTDPVENQKCGRDLDPRRVYFNSANNARNLEALRKKLSISKWNMLSCRVIFCSALPEVLSNFHHGQSIQNSKKRSRW